MSVIGNPILLLNQSPSYVLEPFATTSDDNFVKLILAAHAGKVNLQTDAGWKTGDKRTISISAFLGGGNVSHSAQIIDIVISSFDDYENCGCVMQFDFADELEAGNRMNSSATNVGGYGNSEMYNTTLPALVNALPTYLRNLLIEFNCKSSLGWASTEIETVTNNKLALRSEVELTASPFYSNAGEGSRLPYYRDSSWSKKRGHSGNSNSWWFRSPRKNDLGNFVGATAAGGISTYAANTYQGVAPFGCI